MRSALREQSTSRSSPNARMRRVRLMTGSECICPGRDVAECRAPRRMNGAGLGRGLETSVEVSRRGVMLVVPPPRTSTDAAASLSWTGMAHFRLPLPSSISKSEYLPLRQTLAVNFQCQRIGIYQLPRTKWHSDRGIENSHLTDSDANHLL